MALKGRVGFALTVAAALLVNSAMVAAQTLSPSPAPPSKAPRVPFEIEAKILQIGRGWAQVEVLKVTRGTGLKAHGKLWVRHTAKTKVLKAGKGASVRDLWIGKTVAITGTTKIGRAHV